MFELFTDTLDTFSFSYRESGKYIGYVIWNFSKRLNCLTVESESEVKS